MGQWVTHSYLQKMVNQTYLDQEITCYFCSKSNFNFCQKTSHYEEELRDKKLNTDISHITKLVYYLLFKKY